MMQDGDDISLLTEIASLYYEENYTQEQIAKVIGISRSGISRLLTRSRELGLVDIHVHHPLRTSAVLRDELKQQFGLQDARVLLNTFPEELVLNQVGALAAHYTDRQIQESQVAGSKAISTIGVSHGTSLLEMLKVLRPRRRLPLNIVQLLGSMDLFATPESDSPEIARRLADAYGARCYGLHAPLLVADTAVCGSLRKERSLQRSFQMMEQMDMALVGIGGIHPKVSRLCQAGYLYENELQDIRRQGAVGDICGCYFDTRGKLCAADVQSRTIAVPFETLLNVPLVIAIASGMAKTEAILGALRTGVVKVLITDETCARTLLHLAMTSERSD